MGSATAPASHSFLYHAACCYSVCIMWKSNICVSLLLCVCAHARVRACAHISMGVGAPHMPWSACGGQRTTLWSGFSPSIFMWVPRIKLQSPGLGGKRLYSLSHLDGAKKKKKFSFFCNSGDEPRTSCTPGKHATGAIYPWPDSKIKDFHIGNYRNKIKVNASQWENVTIAGVTRPCSGTSCTS